MAYQGRSTLELQSQTQFYDDADVIIFVYSVTTANQNPSVAQTSIISIPNFANAFANSLQIQVQQADPANSTALTINQGQVFASNTYLYVAIANNVTMRTPLSAF